jgi:predicted Zn-dependent protease
MRVRTTTAASLFFAASLTACATNPATGKKQISLMSEEQEIALGQQSDPEVKREMGVYGDSRLQEYVQGIGMKLARASERPNLPWHFTVVDSPAVNAFALPGGYIYITRGILPFLDDEAQLAGVLGHEIGHVTARHAAQQYTSQTGAGLGLTLLSIFVPEARPFQGLAEQAAALLFLKYGRDDELQADRLGVRYASRTGWNPSGVQNMLTTLLRLDKASGSTKGVPNWLSTHPTPQDRVQKVDASIREALAGAPASALTTNREGFLQHVDGIIYGDAPSEGVMRGNTFLHKDLRFAMMFPAGWEVHNTKEQVVAKAPDREEYLLLQLIAQPRGSVQQVAQASMANAGWRQVSGQRANVNGLDAYVGTYQGRMQGLGNVGTLVAHIVHDQKVFVLAGLSPANRFRGAAQQFEQAIQSFRPLTRSEAENIRPNRVDLYTVRPNDTWTSIAERATDGTIKPSTLAIMNDHDPSEPPRPGDRVKIVVEG